MSVFITFDHFWCILSGGREAETERERERKKVTIRRVLSVPLGEVGGAEKGKEKQKQKQKEKEKRTIPELPSPIRRPSSVLPPYPL
jgi:hypothetical protein